MNLFEFLLVVVSILVGLGITEVLGGVGRILRGDLQAGKLHTLWIVIVLQLQLQLAWGLWGLQGREAWRYPEFLLLLAGPSILYMAAAVLFPSSGTIPCDQYLLQRRRAFFGLNAGYVVFTALLEWFLFNDSLSLVTTFQRLVAFACLVTLALTSDRRVHWVLGLTVLAGHLWWTYLYVFVIGAAPAVQ